MSFFEPLPPPPPHRPHRQPPWLAPPRNELPIGVPAEILVARVPDAAVMLGGIRVFSTGFELALTAVARGDAVSRELSPGRMRGRDAVRFGLRCSDGTRAESERGATGDGTERTLVSRGGGGDGTSWHFAYWSWPLPPPGEIELFCLWEQAGIDESRAVLDAAPILAAAARVEQLWPEEDPVPGGTWSTYTGYARGEG